MDRAVTIFILILALLLIRYISQTKIKNTEHQENFIVGEPPFIKHEPSDNYYYKNTLPTRFLESKTKFVPPRSFPYGLRKNVDVSAPSDYKYETTPTNIEPVQSDSNMGEFYIYPLHKYENVGFQNDSNILYGKCNSCVSEECKNVYTNCYTNLKVCNGKCPCMPYGHKSPCTIDNTDGSSICTQQYWPKDLYPMLNEKSTKDLDNNATN